MSKVNENALPFADAATIGMFSTQIDLLGQITPIVTFPTFTNYPSQSKPKG